MTTQRHQIDPLVPRLPAEETPTLAADGGEAATRGDRPRDFDRPPRTDHAPTDRCREEIEPLVPDLR